MNLLCVFCAVDMKMSCLKKCLFEIHPAVSLPPLIDMKKKHFFIRVSVFLD
uniref:Uncharacterized protein n=1 Tax=Arundo donax TaxID=35708 RepID=A0A0A9D3M7_ARUDO